MGAAREEVLVFSPFVTFQGMRAVSRACKEVSSRLLLVRWRLDDLLAGASDTAAVRMALGAGWSVRRDTGLHAKIVLVDARHAIVGSANVTSKGLGLDGRGNFECTAVVHSSLGFYQNCRDHFERAVKVDLALVEAVDAHLRTSVRAESTIDADRDFEALFVSSVSWLGLEESSWPIELTRVQFSDPPTSAQKAALCDVLEEYCSANDLQARRALLESEFVHALLEPAMCDIGFGAARQVVRYHLDANDWHQISDTSVTQALFAWMARYLPDVVDVYRPRHREVLRQVGSLSTAASQ
ncbi:MAG: hypothetical protein H6828_07470 [Planctomycetes bacterium]|nr:hypothetical protein [Planctomycetota bacterium]